MEVILILGTVALIGVAVYACLSAHGNSMTVARYEKQFEHQKQELRQAALINKKLRAERDVLMDLCVKYKTKAEGRVATQFNRDQLTTLIQLCHPDKHGGKQSAHEVTQVLIAMRNQTK
jgi:NAD dependent epimerase/dehydratase family enzyme